MGFHETPSWVSRTWAARVGESLFSVLFPSDCRSCGEPLLTVSRLPVCPKCLTEIDPVRSKVCATGGQRVLSSYANPVSDGSEHCPVCRRIDRPFVRAVAYGIYESGLRELVDLLKYEGVRPAAGVLGRMLAEVVAALAPEFEEPAVMVIPVPLFKGKRHQRGFNQAELIANATLKSLPREKFSLRADVFERTRDTHSQIGLTSGQGRENLRGAFAVSSSAEVTGREVLLVNDVYATGTTVTECARILRSAGAAKVWVATVVRTLKLASKQEQDFKVSEFQGCKRRTLRDRS
jgi:ComF family protein